MFFRSLPVKDYSRKNNGTNTFR